MCFIVFEIVPGCYIFIMYLFRSKGARVVTNYVSQIWNGKIYMSIPTTS